MIPNDWLSFLYGAVTVAVAWFLSSFFGSAGGDAWVWLKRKIKPEPAPPMQVDARFAPDQIDPSSIAWVGEAFLYQYESQGYRFYRHPPNRARCYRELISDDERYKEWLMVKHGQ